MLGILLHIDTSPITKSQACGALNHTVALATDFLTFARLQAQAAMKLVVRGVHTFAVTESEPGGACDNTLALFAGFSLLTRVST